MLDLHDVADGKFRSIGRKRKKNSKTGKPLNRTAGG